MAFDAKTNWKYDDPVMEDDFNRWEKGIKDAHNLVDAIGTDLTTFKNRRDNPHSVTKGQVGLGNVDNVKQASKAEFDSHANNKNNPHGVTSSQVNIIPYRPATDSGNDYPLGITSFQVQSGGLDAGYPLNYGIVMSNNQANNRFTQYFHGHWNNSLSFAGMWYRHWYNDKGWSNWFQVETTDGSQAKVNAHANLKNNPHAVTKAQVGLGNVDNVKQASKAEFDTHDTDNIRHVTATERTKWNAAEENALDWVKSFGIGTDRAIYLRDDDLNVVREGGLYYVGANTVNKPVTDNGYLLVLPYTSTYTAQIYLTNGKGNMYTRVSTNAGSTWEAWKALETTEGALAKVNAHANLKNNPHNVTTNQVNVIPYIPASTSGNTYPVGVTTFNVEDTGLADGYPQNYGVVLNIKISHIRFTQWFYRHGFTVDTVGAYYRHWHSTYGWSEWQDVESKAGAQSKADKALEAAKVYSMNVIAVYDGGKLDPNTTQEAYILTNHENSPGSGYWHIHTYFYSSRTGNRAQTAISYSGSTPRMMIRHMYGGTWSPWEELSKEGHKHVWADITDVGNASTSTRGIVQLSTATNSTSTTLAATPSAVKSAYDLAAGRETPAGAQAKADKALNDAKSYFTEGTGWKKPTLLNGYTEGDSTEPLRYKKVGNLLFLQVTAYGTAYGTAKPIFTLPEGYRPEYDIFPSVTLIGNYKTARGFIFKDGGVGLSSNSTDVSGMTGVMLHIVVPLS